jgi:5-methylcytosine-specific restriction enzyme A
MPAFAENAQDRPWRTWYTLQRWRRRAKHQLTIEPLCAECLKTGRVTAATIADHNPPHKGDWTKFRLGPLQSLCADHHNRKWADDRHGYTTTIGDDGFPLDPKHPFNRAGAAKAAALAVVMALLGVAIGVLPGVLSDLAASPRGVMDGGR